MIGTMRSRATGFALTLACLTAAFAPAAAAAPRVAVSGGVVSVDGRPFFPFLVWEQCAAQAEDNLALGANVFLAGRCDPGALAERLAGRAYVATDYALLGQEAPGLIGYHQPDEPDGHRIAPEALQSPQAAEQQNRVVFETLTSHFSSFFAPLPWTTRDDYPRYVAKADVVGFDLYPVSYYCGNQWIGLHSVYDEQRELVSLAAPRATFQWIEVNDLQGRCGRGVVTPATIRAESWLAIAGGATALGFFTHGGPTRPLEPFSVAPDNRTAVAQTVGQIRDLAPVLLAQQVPAQAAAPICVGARRADGHTWLIAVNPAAARVSETFRADGFAEGTATVWGEVRTVPVHAGRLTDTFDPLAVHVYELNLSPAPEAIDEPQSLHRRRQR